MYSLGRNVRGLNFDRSTDSLSPDRSSFSVANTKTLSRNYRAVWKEDIPRILAVSVRFQFEGVYLRFVVKKPVLFKGSDGELLDFHHERTGSISEQSMWDFWCTKWLWNCFFSRYFCIPLISVILPAQRIIPFIHSFILLFFYLIISLPPPLYNFSNWQRS